MPSSPEAIRTQILDLVKEYHTAKFASKTFDPDKDLVHYAGRVFDAEEIVNLVDASLDFYLTANRYAERFEAEFADYLGLSNALLVNSGSSANLVALTALTSPKLKDRRLKPGDEVITTACGFPTTLNPILQNQLIPVFVDVNLGDYTAIPERLTAAPVPSGPGSTSWNPSAVTCSSALPCGKILKNIPVPGTSAPRTAAI
jgi:CDP-6-deoxy-D-xylo-4-hexulose-3-dehydrase